jgi:hypothetical protein
MVTFRAKAADRNHVWWLWVVGVLVAWLGIALAVAVVVGRGIRIADRRSPGTGAVPLITTADAPEVVSVEPAAARVRRRAIPLPNVGVALVVLAVALEASGYVARLTGTTGDSARLLSMDAPLSLPRMFVTLLFAASALAAFAGAGSLPGRRAWWTAVGVVAAAIAVVKGGGNVHAYALHALSKAIGGSAALAVSVFLAVAVVAGLWFLSRDERRDRRRVLSVLALYAVAAVGLSGLSSLVGENFGATWTAAATFIEESSEALAAVAFLMAVLAGVAPRLVLPADWALRREVDAHTLDLPESVQGRSTAGGTVIG